MRQWQHGSQISVFLFLTEPFCTSQLFWFYLIVNLVNDLVCMNMENEDYSNFQWPTQTPMAFTTSIHPGFPYVQTYRVGRAGMSENLQKLS